MADASMDNYNGKISGHVLVLSSTECRKFSLVQRMGCNGISGQLEKIHWISKVDLSEEQTSWQICFLLWLIPSMVNSMIICRKFGYILLYVLHYTPASSPRWRDTPSQTRIFCIFPSAANLLINHLVNFVRRSKVGYISKQQMWLTTLFQELGNQTSYSCFGVDNCPQSFGAAKYRS